MSPTSPHGQPVGEPVSWSPRPAPGPVVLQGAGVRLEPLSDGHVDALHAALCRPDDDSLWTYLTEERPLSRGELGQRVERLSSLPDQGFAVVTADGPQGMLSLMRADPAHGSVEVGRIVLSRRLQRTRAATEALVLVARHVLDDLGYRRYEWKCDSLNEASRRAALRLGFVEEGRFRQALVYKGRNRDTDWFSITDADWPALRAAYDAWLRDDNFDAGVQRTALSTLTARAAAGR